MSYAKGAVVSLRAWLTFGGLGVAAAFGYRQSGR